MNHYVTPAGAGLNDGTSWSNAWANFSGIDWGSVDAGDTIWFAGTNGTLGTPYGQCVVGASGTAGNPIQIMRATAADTACTSSPGWSAGFDSQAYLTTTESYAVEVYLVDYITVDGRTWGGLKVAGARIPSDLNEQMACIYSVGDGHTFRYIETTTPNRNDLWYAGLNYGQTSAGAKTNLTVQYCYFHDCSQGMFGANYIGVLVEYCEFYKIGFGSIGTGPSQHPNPYYVGDSQQVTFRYNRMHLAAPTGFYVSPFGAVDYFYIYGNVFYDMTEDYMNAIQIDPNNTAVGPHFYVYNNTFWTGGAAIRAAASGTRFAGPSILGAQIYNNIFFNCSLSTADNPVTRDYNRYSNSDAWSESEAHSVVVGGDPFVNSGTGDFHLTSDTANGSALDSPYDTDPDGVTRIPGSWSMGAYQFSSGGGGGGGTISATTSTIACAARLTANLRGLTPRPTTPPPVIKRPCSRRVAPARSPMNPFDAHQSALAAYNTWLGRETPQTESTTVPVFTWNGSDYTCNASWVKQQDLSAGGFIPMDDLVLEVLEPMCGTPEPTQTVTFEDRTFMIRTVTMAAGKFPKLTCFDQVSGA